MRIQWQLALSVILISSAGALASEFHVTPHGSPQGDGSLARPWDLATALAGSANPPEKVHPGDTVWLHGGTYRGGFESRLAGSPESPIVVRGLKGDRVTIDINPRDDGDRGALFIDGSDTVYRDFEVTCSHSLRRTEIAGSWPADIRRQSVDVRGSRISLINLVVHDLGSGFGFWAEGEGGEISGCLIYNNGWRGPDRGHGHAIYAQNARGTKRIADNVIFHQFAYGIHVYGSERASLKGFEIERNIAFENGCLTRKGDNAPGIIVGGATSAERIAIRNNVVVGGGMRLGYPWGTTSEDVACIGNYCEGLVVRDFRRATILQNTIVASSSVVILEGAARVLLANHRWDENDYYVTDGKWGECAIVEGSKSRGLTYTEWLQETGQDAHSTFTKGSPRELRVIVWPNAHEPGRAHVAVLNPQSLPEVEVDLTQVLSVGQGYRIVSAKDVFGPSLAEGTCDGRPVRLSMKPVTPPPPVGMPDEELPVTEPKFAAFVVLPAGD